MSNLIRAGRCWKIGDDVASDALISAHHTFEYDPKVLRKHLLHDLRPELAGLAQPGDTLLAGRRFGHGSHHSHPFLAMSDIGLGLLAQSLTRAPFRLAVFMAVPLLEIGRDVVDGIADGDHLHIDYGAGRIENRTQGRVFNVAPLPDFLLEIVAAGGGLDYLRHFDHAIQSH
ncbi:MAG: 3-isopropylmalate dehydratase [Burkholderiales bacterium]